MVTCAVRLLSLQAIAAKKPAAPPPTTTTRVAGVSSLPSGGELETGFMAPCYPEGAENQAGRLARRLADQRHVTSVNRVHYNAPSGPLTIG